jgi:hypothetical protein
LESEQKTAVDEEKIIHAIVALLLRRPGEWLSFRQIASSIRVPGCDDILVGALAEFRFDLFSISDDRRLKLRTGVTESIAKQGISAWHVPPRPEAGHRERVHEASPSPIPVGHCYCSLSENLVLLDLVNNSVPDSALMYSHCWRHICRVRGLFFSQVADETWREICQRRGYLRERENPRGF